MFKRVKKLLTLAGLAVVAKEGRKVADQYKENNPDGVGDVNGDGVVDYKDKAAEVVRAAKETLKK